MSNQPSTGTNPHPLRPYYQPTPRSQEPIISHWNTPSASSISASSTSSLSQSSLPGGPLSSLLQASLPSGSGTSLFNRSYSTPALADHDLALSPNTYSLNFSDLLRGYISSGLMAFTSAAMVMPFEVGKTLLQVQWIPSDGLQHPTLLPGESADDCYDDDEDEENIEAYFTPIRPSLRPSLGSTISKRSLSGSTTTGANRSKTGTIQWPEHILPVVVERGVMDMIRAIYKWRGEGFLALWKGQLTTFIIDTLSSNLQPLFLSALFLVSSTPSSISLPLEHHAYPGLPLVLSVSSYLITGLLLSPLDVVRTRLIVQSSQLRHRTYSGPLDGFRQIVRTEGGYRALFLHPTLFFPAVLDNLLRPLFHLASPLIIDRFLAIDRSQEPVRYGLAEFALSTAGLILILPLETVRKRLQLQSRAEAEAAAFKACVHLRPTPYNGIVEALYRIITEEKAGFLGLFRGFNVGLTANAVVFFLGLIGNKSHNSNFNHGPSGGWAEV